MAAQTPADAGTPRFEFGRNWRRYLDRVDEGRIATAEGSLKEMLGRPDLEAVRFLDIGCGSGLFSLAARRLGAIVHSYDLDPDSVACTRTIAERHGFAGDSRWTVEQGSVLDPAFTARLGSFDVVYAWGVLHHTGDMGRAIGNAARAVAEGGQFYLAIYHDQGWISRYWRCVKWLYNRVRPLRPLLVLWHLPFTLGARLAVRALAGRLEGERGMALWYDFIDWLGGYPFEVAKPAEIVRLLERRGFRLTKSVLVRGNRGGCNEFVFERVSER